MLLTSTFLSASTALCSAQRRSSRRKTDCNVTCSRESKAIPFRAKKTQINPQWHKYASVLHQPPHVTDTSSGVSSVTHSEKWRRTRIANCCAKHKYSLDFFHFVRATSSVSFLSVLYSCVSVMTSYDHLLCSKLWPLEGRQSRNATKLLKANQDFMFTLKVSGFLNRHFINQLNINKPQNVCTYWLFL